MAQNSYAPLREGRPSQVVTGWRPTKMQALSASLIEQFVLADGRTVSVRPILPTDGDAEQAFVMELSVESRRARFHGGLVTLSDAVLRSFTQPDYRTHVAIVAEGRDARIARRIVADARYVLRDGGGEADFAIAVTDAWQRVGLGTLMANQLGAHAKRNGVRFLAGEVLKSNTSMIALVRSLGGRLAQHPQDRLLLCAHFAL